MASPAVLKNPDDTEWQGFPDGVSAGYVDEDGVVHPVDVGDSAPDWVRRLRAKVDG